MSTCLASVKTLRRRFSLNSKIDLSRGGLGSSGPTDVASSDAILQEDYHGRWSSRASYILMMQAQTAHSLSDLSDPWLSDLLFFSPCWWRTARALFVTVFTRTLNPITTIELTNHRVGNSYNVTTLMQVSSKSVTQVLWPEFWTKLRLVTLWQN